MKISIVIPVFNEEAVIAATIREISRVASALKESFEVLIVDDGSVDSPRNAVAEIKDGCPITVITLSRNYGKEAAMFAGLAYADGDAVIMMDGDLQHPPDLIPVFIEKWRAGAKIVNGVHSRRPKQGIIHGWLSTLFYKVMRLLSGMDLEGQSDFKLLDKAAVKALRKMPERNRFFRGLTAWIGLPSQDVPFEAAERAAGVTKWSWFSLFRYAGKNLIAFSDLPLIAVAFLGLFMLLFCGLLAAQTLYHYLSGKALDGFTTVILLEAIMSSVIVLSLGIVAIYIGQVLREVKGRPHVVVEDIWPAGGGTSRENKDLIL